MFNIRIEQGFNKEGWNINKWIVDCAHWRTVLGETEEEAVMNLLVMIDELKSQFDNYLNEIKAKKEANK